jgi:mRNA-degrading endonuclease RelE of RelBE toxin-antitoxin system
MLVIRRVEMTPRFVRTFTAMPTEVQKAFGKQLGLLLQDTTHPSLDLKLYDKAKGTWQARVTKGYRFYFTTTQDLATLLEIRAHDF